MGYVEIPQNLLVLSGLSALTYGGARAVTTQKLKNGKSNGDIKDPQRENLKPASFYNLVQNDKDKPDIGDFQMLFITLLAIVVYFVTAFHFLGALSLASHITLPDVDTTLLSGFGISQGSYLVKKMASNVGEG